MLGVLKDMGEMTNKAICEMTYEEACDAYSEAVIMCGDMVNVTSRERIYWFGRAEAIRLYVCENFLVD